MACHTISGDSRAGLCLGKNKCEFAFERDGFGKAILRTRKEIFFLKAATNKGKSCEQQNEEVFREWLS
jgi:hypothetical protein